MQPSYGRFGVLGLSNGGLLLARLVEGPVLQVVAGDKAYCSAALTHENADHFVVQGRQQQLPSESLISLLLAIPTTTCTLQTESLPAPPLQSHPTTKAKLLLSCIDASHLQLHLTIHLTQIPSANILTQLHHSLIIAVASLEATLRDTAGDKDSDFLQPHTQHMSLATVSDQFLPLKLMGQNVETVQAFRKAAAADVRMQANRAFVVAECAASVRTNILEQRRLRKEREERKKREERERLRLLQQRMSQANNSNGRMRAIGNVRKRAFVQNDEEESQREENPPVKPIRKKSAFVDDHDGEQEEEEEDVVNNQPKEEIQPTRREQSPATEQQVEQPTSDAPSHQAAEDQIQAPAAPAAPAAPLATPATPPGPKKKKRRKLRALV